MTDFSSEVAFINKTLHWNLVLNLYGKRKGSRMFDRLEITKWFLRLISLIKLSSSYPILHAIFGLRVLSLPASACVSICVCVSVCQPQVCPDRNCSPVQARKIKLIPEVLNALVKTPIVAGVGIYQA